ncbi:YALI0E24585p [Yarrowia lipolytica CLIB122]|uniref:YALI0E24585p n=2 Tax=Yarrowia lipolytica TaxID=4952 RepID=Q6C4Q3_YARLI|nr:YALI0E24585p [Yarrowia lipolytica CLIB122]AOW05921.1 hypothetical protein YALI1_E29263g [Yarrowia lipolytica]KAB8285887.1 hypothetical protein BKA91DRAFT_132329 [Yarrowia lipolytica]KAE8171774.1 hypothetical protein BKA90DRAFT_138455 [Yarrowia lipolytica]KAJ8057334.1 hypothetical protein LXG23DRAFT_34215 [Yarrowia lipolytica]RMI98569.1 hypothetical protein BD777DRAFT_124690 [Yarrowia lipolytica]|eukprot:XP_504359.1 YALI0E24585p [Yarrowia lipolytica CLIB122]
MSMDTRKSDTKELSLVEIVDLVWTSTEEIGQDLKQKGERLSKHYAEQLEQALTTPVLAVPSTKEQCIEATRDLKHKYNKLVEELRPSRDSFQLSLNRHVALLKRVDQMSRQFSRKVRKQTEKDKFLGYQDRALDSLSFFFDRASRDDLDSETLQKCLQEMMEGQDEELREWYFMEELSRFGRHVTESLRPKPDVIIEDKVVSLSRRLELSPECISLVYSHCDLETCVSLRQVSSAWYKVFGQINHIWRSKMRERNPFIEPGDADMKSYADCVLVFVARLKWPTVSNLNDMEVSGEPAERNKVVGFELGLNEKLPSNFTGMMPFESGCTVACDHFFALAAWESQEFIRDLWDLSSRPKDEPYEVIGVGEHGTVVKYRDIEVTLPPSVRPEDIVPFTGHNTPVHLGTMIITVELLDGRMISIPRDDPHYEHGYIFNAPGARLFQIGNVHFARESPGLIHKKAVYRYRFADFESRKMIEYGAGRHVYPVAAYNGCIWWHLMAVPNSLVPTFVDLRTPEKIHFQPNRAICGVSAKLFEQSFRDRDTSQFVVSITDIGIQVVDLDRGVITEVTGPSDKPAARFFPGYWNGKFMARCMSEVVVQATTELVLQEHGVPEEEWRV